jgi:hypothetical protein
MYMKTLGFIHKAMGIKRGEAVRHRLQTGALCCLPSPFNLGIEFFPEPVGKEIDPYHQ